MKDKRKLSEKPVPDKDWRFFPSVNRDGLYYEYWIYTPDHVGYIVLEEIDPDVLNLHIHIKPQSRSKKTFQTLVDMYNEMLLPMLRTQGYKQLIVNCAYDDVKTKELFKTFNFEPHPIWIGVTDLED